MVPRLTISWSSKSSHWHTGRREALEGYHDYSWPPSPVKSTHSTVRRFIYFCYLQNNKVIEVLFVNTCSFWGLYNSFIGRSSLYFDLFLVIEIALIYHEPTEPHLPSYCFPAYGLCTTGRVKFTENKYYDLRFYVT